MLHNEAPLVGWGIEELLDVRHRFEVRISAVQELFGRGFILNLSRLLGDSIVSLKQSLAQISCHSNSD